MAAHTPMTPEAYDLPHHDSFLFFFLNNTFSKRLTKEWRALLQFLHKIFPTK